MRKDEVDYPGSGFIAEYLREVNEPSRTLRFGWPVTEAEFRVDMRKSRIRFESETEHEVIIVIEPKD